MGCQKKQGSYAENEYLFWLSQIPGIGAMTIRKLYVRFGSYQEVYRAASYNIEEKELAAELRLKSGQWSSICGAAAKLERCREAIEEMAKRNISFLAHLDPLYPQKLLEIPDYPVGLYIRGKIPEETIPSVAIVGARNCSAYGEQIAEEFARMLSKEGVQIISGLALGIDSAAHRGALKGETATYGVLGCGVNICYPSSNYKLYEKMIESGGIISEFPLNTKPKPGNFPMRNRIISGMADAVLVVEAKERSGSLITAEMGLEQGREIFAVPGRITDCLSKGCNDLIQQGAHLANSPNDILEYLGVKCRKELIIHEKNVNGLAKMEKIVYSCMDFKPKHLDQIVSECGLSITECMGILMELELGGYIFRTGNHYYGRKL
ncbi:MAG: DNA-processing protein DprA [Brotaphodocola sp.]